MSPSEYVKAIGFPSLRYVAEKLELSEAGLRKMWFTRNLRFKAMVVGLYTLERLTV